MCHLGRVLRRIVFIEEMQEAAEAQFDDVDDVARHVIAMRGDGALGYGRYRLQELQGRQIAVVDRMCIRRQQRRQGIARAMLNSIVEDASNVTPPLAALFIVVPMAETALIDRLAAGVGTLSTCTPLTHPVVAPP